MVRRGSSALLALATAAVLASGCADDGDGQDGDAGETGPPTTGEPSPATLPGDAQAGRGQLVLGGQAYALTVRSCSLQPTTDPATGVTTEVAIDADDELGVAVSITRAATEGDLRTVTDTVTVVDPDGGLTEAQRADRSGTYLDLRVDGPLTPLLTVEGTLVRGEGVFGPAGSRAGDPSLLEGGVVVRCPT